MKRDWASELRAIADGRLMLNVRNGVTVSRSMLAMIADEIDALRAAPLTPAEAGGLVERLEYHVGNPSAWDSYDEGASELIREAATALEAQAVEIARCHARLEIDHYYVMPPNGQGDTTDDLVRVEVPLPDRINEVDGIYARDATIKLVEDALASERAAHAETKRERDEALKALEPFASVAELIEVDTEGFSETDIFDLTFDCYLFEHFTLAQFNAARRVREGGKS